MLKRLQFASLHRFAVSLAGDASSKSDKYIVIPTTFPVSPYYFYSTKINRFLYDYLQKHKIKYVAAFPIRPGVYPRPFKPKGEEQF